ncbi:hypothetical protein L249_5871 [Ophiocordyceps polyrhachis-furcata BCC 54312]|uniref:Uncharacterized protein n=1 Tax=Ophiocordyceps polyrhachis-furcata BCC 54312 TaxID=1330021 RepID=A0A367L0B8_9HYPO|nr:hypothetical protein L249_5871 [Ophiocordyceps polyrhachis-furcata BCC 54312]
MSRNGFRVDTTGEVEAARELADAAFCKPIFGLVLRLHLLLHGLALISALVIAGVGVVVFLRLILDGSLMKRVTRRRRLALLFGDGPSLAPVLEMTGRPGPLDTATDEHRLRIGKLNANLILVHPRKFAVKLIVLSRLAHVELWLPAGETFAATTTSLLRRLTRVVVKVIQKAEERGEGRGVRVVEVAREEGHESSIKPFIYTQKGSSIEPSATSEKQIDDSGNDTKHVFHFCRPWKPLDFFAQRDASVVKLRTKPHRQISQPALSRQLSSSCHLVLPGASPSLDNMPHHLLDSNLGTTHITNPPPRHHNAISIT